MYVYLWTYGRLCIHKSIRYMSWYKCVRVSVCGCCFTLLLLLLRFGIPSLLFCRRLTGKGAAIAPLLLRLSLKRDADLFFLFSAFIQFSFLLVRFIFFCSRRSYNGREFRGGPYKSCCGGISK